MKKTVAAGSAVALGVMGAAMPLMAFPAQAASATSCDFSGDFSFTDTVDNWYGTCIPQYGVGKAEFTISSDTDFPAEFKDLTDPSVTVTTTADLADMTSYFGTDPAYTSPLDGLTRIDDGTNPKLQRYQASDFDHNQAALMKVASTAEISPSDLPSACGPFTYDRAFTVAFEPLDVTFTQTVNSEPWTYHVVISPDTLYIGGTLQPGGWDGGAPLCMAQGTFASGGLTAAEEGWTATSADSTVLNMYPSMTGDYFVGDYPRAALPATGLELAAPLGLAGGLLVAGLSVLAIRRRRA